MGSPGDEVAELREVYVRARVRTEDHVEGAVLENVLEARDCLPADVQEIVRDRNDQVRALTREVGPTVVEERLDVGNGDRSPRLLDSSDQHRVRGNPRTEDEYERLHRSGALPRPFTVMPRRPREAARFRVSLSECDPKGEKTWTSRKLQH